jgi:splicing factor U2AF subunit
MSERLAKIFGTEEDKVNCPFYFKIGACRHGETCTRIHNKPPASQTMVFPHLYDNPPAAVAFADGLNVPQENLVEAVNHFEDFYEEVFTELAKFGELEEMVVADNIGEHMIGNVYVKYQSEDQAQAAMQGLNGRYYAGKVIVAEFSPVTDFREAKCRQYNEGQCDRGGYCNFMHLKKIGPDLERDLYPDGRGQSRGYSGGAYGRSERAFLLRFMHRQSARDVRLRGACQAARAILRFRGKPCFVGHGRLL